MLNTSIFLTSEISLTWAHYGLIGRNNSQATQRLLFTVLLGIYFTILQAYEYRGNNSATGFHRIHVLIGTTPLLICQLHHINNHFSRSHHFGFEAAACY